MAKKQPTKKTRRRINKLCEYIDYLLKVWKTEKGDYNTCRRMSCRADFIAGILKIDTYQKAQNANWFEITHAKAEEAEQLEAWKNCPQEHRWKKQPSTEERLIEIKQKAIALKGQEIPEIEQGPRLNGEKTEEKLNRLLTSLQDIQEIHEFNANSDELDLPGKRANQMIVEMGLYSRWWELAHKTNLISDTKLPYFPYQYSPTARANTLSLSDFEPNLSKYSDSDKIRVNRWVTRIQKELNELKSEKDNIDPRKRRKMGREVEIALILKKNPTITISRLAKKLNVSEATISRSEVFQLHKSKPPQSQFSDCIEADEYD